ncbi:uncharacterized protein [Amphiura filiformis]|uniref:uncharacterized protein n=1 Tax=Amphiura filiformis TaxID=82378 RepID=UPI003B2262D6
MGCCFSSPVDDDKEEVIRVRAHSRIPPIKKTDSYGTLSNDDSDSLEIKQGKEEQNQVELEKAKPKPVSSSKKVFGKLTGGKSPKSRIEEPSNPFESGKKSKLKRGYATREGYKNKPSTKYAQDSTVHNKIKAGHSYGTLSNDEDNSQELNRVKGENNLQECTNPKPVPSLQKVFKKDGDQSKPAAKYGQTSPGLHRMKIVQSENSSPNLNEPSSDSRNNILDKPSEPIEITTNGIEKKRNGVTAFEPGSQSSNSSICVTPKSQDDVNSPPFSISDDSGTIGMSGQKENIKLSDTKAAKAKKKNTPKKIASKIGKYLPGKKNKSK